MKNLHKQIPFHYVSLNLHRRKKNNSRLNLNTHSKNPQTVRISIRMINNEVNKEID